jgi:hypothetical protein
MCGHGARTAVLRAGWAATHLVFCDHAGAAPRVHLAPQAPRGRGHGCHDLAARGRPLARSGRSPSVPCGKLPAPERLVCCRERRLVCRNAGERCTKHVVHPENAKAGIEQCWLVGQTCDARGYASQCVCLNACCGPAHDTCDFTPKQVVLRSAAVFSPAPPSIDGKPAVTSTATSGGSIRNTLLPLHPSAPVPSLAPPFVGDAPACRFAGGASAGGWVGCGARLRFLGALARAVTGAASAPDSCSASRST